MGGLRKVCKLLISRLAIILANDNHFSDNVRYRMRLMLPSSSFKGVGPLKSMWSINLHLPSIIRLQPIVETRQSPGRSASTCSIVAVTSRRNSGSPVLCISTTTAIRQ
jgi:hypothetical protein